MNRALDIFRNALWQLTEEQPRQPPAPTLPDSPFHSVFTFRHSRTELSVRGGDAHVKRSETRYENGKFVTEECEGTVDRAAYDRMVDQTQQYFIDQTNQAVKMFFQPFASSTRKRDE